MIDSDGAAVDVHPVGVGAAVGQPGQHHRIEGLVVLHQIDLVDVHPGPAQGVVSEIPIRQNLRSKHLKDRAGDKRALMCLLGSVVGAHQAGSCRGKILKVSLKQPSIS
jgi:hypothetical protein